MCERYRGIYIGEVTVGTLPRLVVVADDNDIARSMIKPRLLTDGVKLRALLLGEYDDEAERLEVFAEGANRPASNIGMSSARVIGLVASKWRTVRRVEMIWSKVLVIVLLLYYSCHDWDRGVRSSLR